MKTTLKRGMGRGAAVNGNGRPVLPPAVLTPITVYRQPPPSRRSGLALFGRIVLWIGVAAATVAAGLAGGAYLYLEQELVEGVQVHSPEVREAAQTLDVAPAGHPATALVIGYDKRAGKEAELTGRSDTVMLLRADPITNTVSMLSFPRDLRVEIRCPGRAPFMDRINRAYSECKEPGTLDTVRHLTGLPINYLITVNYRGFKQVVAKLGGVWIDVDRRYFNDNTDGGERYATIDLHPGYQKLNGSRSLDFVRFRHSDSDLYRLARQQLFVRAFNQQLRSAFSPTKIPAIVKVITENVQVGRAGAKDLSARLLFSYGLFAFGLPQGHFFQAKIEGLEDAVDPVAGYYIHTDPSNIQTAVQEFAHPDVDAPAEATNAALGRRPKRAPAPPPGRTTVVVLNGNAVEGAAATGSYLLAQRGYVTLEPTGGVMANAPRQDYARTTIYYDERRPVAAAAGRKLADVFGTADVVPMRGRIARLSNGALLVAVLGRSFEGSLPPAAAAAQAPKSQPPNVRRDPGQSLEHLRSVRRRVDFPLLLPTVVERSSYIDRELPVRAYAIAGHRAVRLTFLSGVEASAYWGIQMTDWEDAPALRDPNETLTLGGRRFDLHYVGPKLHMVVLRENGASYWVVNTLLNTLSNETMLAIARGLKPLPR